MNIEKALQTASAFYRKGDLSQAEQIFKKIREKKPNQQDALHFLGLISFLKRDFDLAIAYFQKELEHNPMSTDAYNNLGLSLHGKGEVEKAILAYQSALKYAPNNSLAFYNLANAYKDIHNFDEAIVYYQKSIQQDPQFAEAYSNLGIVYIARGKIDEAVSCYQKALQINPHLAEVYNNLGFALQKKNLIEEAISCYQKALHFNPNLADAYNNLGNIFRTKGSFDKAIQYFQKSIQLSPASSNTYVNLANTYKEINQTEKAIHYYQKAIELNPDLPEAHADLGDILREQGAVDKAIEHFRKALQSNASDPKVLNNYGLALYDKGDPDGAISYYQKAIELEPRLVEAYNNYGLSLLEKGYPDKALDAYQRAITFKPEVPDTHLNMALVLLLKGDFKQGWAEYEWRWKAKAFMSQKFNFNQPQWDGSNISDKTILLHAEQGIGDTIQFVRYVLRVRQLGGKVITACREELKSLLVNDKHFGNVVSFQDPIPDFDVHCPLLSLPFIFHTAIETIPAEMPYITADTAFINRWRDKIQPDNSFKIGVVWSGNPKYKRDRVRSCSLATFAPLAEYHGITFYSLQKGAGADQAKHPPAGMKLIDLTDEINDFSDTAALIAHLDLVISVDTAVAHLAGAMGKPVWILLPFVPDWRWMLDRKDSPWYPTMKLFRQPKPGDWNSVIDHMVEELSRITNEGYSNKKESFFSPITHQEKTSINTNTANEYFNLGIDLKKKGQIEQAIACYKQAIQYDIQYVEAYNNLGTALVENNQIDEAVFFFNKALQLKPDLVPAHCNLGNALRDKGNLDEAITCYERALSYDQDFVDAHWNMSLALLLKGTFERGWKEYEWRWKTEEFLGHRCNYPHPLWDGSDIKGKTILLHQEQGFGDAIQFIRYATFVKQYGAKVIFGCHKELKALLRNVRGIDHITAYGEILPEFHVRCRLLSLPRIFNTTLDTIPAEIPYIEADPFLIKKWEKIMRYNDYQHRIGIVWAGSPDHERDRFRSVPLEALSPLSQGNDILFYSLQKGVAAELGKNPPAGMKLIDLTEQINDFSDTAALIAQLDLVISVDTAVAHLAGAMGKPVWTLLPFVPDWRWQLDRADSPWYPTMRLFRQPASGDWDSVIISVKEELAKNFTQ
jgi:tetratricopeptide (TPR) repeat protein